jgi:hypothetical protein
MNIINEKYHEQFYLLSLSQIYSRKINKALKITLDAESPYAIDYKFFIYTVCGSPLPPSPRALLCWLLRGNVCYMHKAICMQNYFAAKEPCAVLYRKLHSAINQRSYSYWWEKRDIILSSQGSLITSCSQG